MPPPARRPGRGHRARMRGLLDAGDDRADVLTRFVGALSPEDERLRGELLQ